MGQGISDQLTVMAGQLTAMDSRLAALKKDVLQRPTSRTAGMTPLRAGCPVPAPMSSLEEFDAFEDKLQDEKYRQQAVGLRPAN
ncbi:unnamed protein product [Dibothriocephalus latus]|uniref:Uncharacterized protein n=1 Tax=Dibothriocephalus latus TaxID=60516 RepID=A0A3P6PNV2_DIBLA|nr:unnamed protein product [Dibothriocephalus latus]